MEKARQFACLKDSAALRRRRTWQRQYLFVAATMPAGAGQTVAGDLGRLFKDLVWLSGPTLHEAQRRVAHAWVAVTEDSWRRALQVGGAGLNRLGPSNGPGRSNGGPSGTGCYP